MESTMDRKKPYIQVERGGETTAAIRVVMPNGGSHLGVVVERTAENAAAFDYLTERLKEGMDF
jgi:hypothetical protein